MSQTSLKSILAINVAVLNEQLKAQCHFMEVTFLVLQSFHHITNDAIECAYMLACHLSAEYFTDDLQKVLILYLVSRLNSQSKSASHTINVINPIKHLYK